MTKMQKRIERGIKLLNREYGRSWLRKIHLDTLDLSDPTSCVLGQVEGDFYDGVERLDIDGAKFGFDTADSGESFYKLNTIWKKRISQLRKRIGLDS